MTYPEFDGNGRQADRGLDWPRFRRPLCFLLCFQLLFWVPAVWAQERQGISDAALEGLTQQAMTEFSVPGMAIGIVKSDRVIFAKGFGLREIGRKDPVDTNTLFKIASNSKAFTTAALATLVDDGLLSWDGLVIDYIPEFRMHDPWVTANFTVKDLLTHRSGLPAHMGDMLLWPEPNLFTAADIIHALRYFKPGSSFRSTYAYDNLLYIVAGEIIPRLTGKTWGEYVEHRVMRAAGMARCFADTIPRGEMKNLATAHGMIEAELGVIERSQIRSQLPVSAAAGGIVCSLDDMLTWVQIQLREGVAPAGFQVFSALQAREMWKPQIFLGVSERDYELNRTHFKAYGLGWRLEDVHGFRQVSHTGSLAGMKSYVVMIPELELGAVLLTNGSSSEARSAVMNSIVRSFMPVDQIDWIQFYREQLHRQQIEAHKEAALQKEQLATVTEDTAEIPGIPCNVPVLSSLTGRYRDPWFGDVTIRIEDGQLAFLSEKSPKLAGPLIHHDGNRFIVRWTDRTLEADAYIQFETAGDGRAAGMSMSKLDDGDFDFEDLDFTRVE